MVDDDHCRCGELDYIEHSLVECRLLANYWKDIRAIIQQLTNHNIPFSTPTMLFGIGAEEASELNITPEDRTIINNILCTAKFAINKSKAEDNNNFSLIFETEWNIRKQQFTYQ